MRVRFPDLACFTFYNIHFCLLFLTLFSLKFNSQEQSPQTVAERQLPSGHRDDRLRHGHRQARRPVHHPPLHVQVHGELLPGVRPRRQGRQAGKVHRVLQVWRHLPHFHHGLHRANGLGEAVRHSCLLLFLR